MPTLLLSFKRNSDSHILIHGTLAPNEKDAEKDLEEHAGICPKFGPAYRAEETIEHVIQVDEIPEFDEEAIAEWVDDLLGSDEDELDEDEEDELGEDEEEEQTANGK